MASEPTTPELVRCLSVYAEDIQDRLDRLPRDGDAEYRRLLFHAGTHALNTLDALNACIARHKAPAD